jgi:hypothetical protein
VTRAASNRGWYDHNNLIPSASSNSRRRQKCGARENAASCWRLHLMFLYNNHWWVTRPVSIRGWCR